MKRLLRDSSGLAMTEGVIVVPFFILIWMGLVSLHSLLEARLAAQSEAGNAAMTMAAAGECGDADLSFDEIPQTAGLDTGMGAEEEEMINSIAGCQPFAWAHASASVEVLAGDVAVPFGGPEMGVTGRRSLMCNMKPVDGLMDLVASVVSEALGLNDD